MLSLDLLQRLRDRPDIFAALADSSGHGLEVQKRLRSRFPADLVRAACLIAELRDRAAGKFSRSDRMWFDRIGLEQSTGELVARHKARRFEGCVWDLCCGIGGDTIALGARGDVVAVDVDPIRARCASWNAEAYDMSDRVTVRISDAMSHQLRGKFVHVDPDRRVRPGKRARHVENYAPGVDALTQLRTSAAGGAIKVSPAADFDRHFAECEIELVSVQRECKEATVWFGSLSGSHRRRATVLPSGDSLTGEIVAPHVSARGLQHCIYDPDPAIVRAGLVNVLCEQLGLGRLDEADEYLTSETPVSSPFLQRFMVEASSAIDEKRLRRWLSGLQIGRLEIKSRRLAINHELLRRRLRLTGDRERTLVLTRVGGRTTAILCRRESMSRAVN